tara:strand:- start:2670 stop:2942 length:273 start_codon:yes stop_codon:yes gene_type:complete
MKQNTDYEMIPNEDSENDHWNIRILTGEFVETIIEFEKLRLEDDQLKFNFNVVGGPRNDLDPEVDLGLQRVAGAVLYDVLGDVQSEAIKA